MSRSAGRALRSARLRFRLSLRRVERLSRGRFKASTVSGYERGERTISLARFCELALLYGVTPQRLLSDALSDMQGGQVTVIDLTKLSAIDGSPADVASRFVQNIRAERGEEEGDVVSLRIGDLELLATATGLPPNELRTTIAPALV